MIRKLDKWWFGVLCKAHGWVVRRAEAHCRREKVRRLRRHIEWQRNQRN